VDRTTTSYGPGEVNWLGAETTSGVLHALQWASSSGNFLGYGSRPLPATAGATYVNQDILLSNAGLSTGTVSGVSYGPEGYTLVIRGLSVMFPPTSAEIWVAGELPNTAFPSTSAKVPSIAGVSTSFVLISYAATTTGDPSCPQLRGGGGDAESGRLSADRTGGSRNGSRARNRTDGRPL
jgi:hypothetical protein